MRRQSNEDEEMDLLERQRGQVTARDAKEEDQRMKDDEGFMDPALQRKLFFEKLTHWTRIFLVNVNAAIVAVAISAPVILSLTLKMNYQMPANENVSSLTALFSLSFGFLMSAFISGNVSTFKSFTLTQASVMLIQISRFGIGAVGPTTSVAGGMILVCYIASIHRQLDIIPACVIFGLKLSVGVIMIITELPRAFALPADPMRENRSSGVLGYIFEQRDQLSVIPFGIFATCVAGFSIISVKAPKILWQTVLLLLFLAGGYFLTPIGQFSNQSGESIARRTIFGDDWGIFRNYDNKFSKTAKYSGLPQKTIFLLIAEPAFIINCGALAFMTLVESTSLAKLVDFNTKTVSDKKKEILGLGISNVLAGMFGFFPVSLPVGRNLVVIQAGASSPLFSAIAAVLTLLITYFLWAVLRHLPMLAVSILTATLALTMIDLKLLVNYWKSSPYNATITTAIVAMSMFFNHFLSMLIGWCFFLIMYCRAEDVDNYGPGDIEFIVQEARIFECTNQHLIKRDSLNGGERGSTMVASIGVPLSVSLLGPNTLGWNSHTHDILQKVATQGAIYELRGRYNFLHAKTHIANIRRYHKSTILIDFRKVFDEDIEFVLEYQYFIGNLRQEPFAVYVTGIPYQKVNQDMMLRGTWIEKLDRDNQIIYIN